jgi:hypothetical protein
MASAAVVHVGGLGQRRGGVAGHRDQRNALLLDGGQQGQQLLGLAGVGQRQHHVVLGDHAQVAVGGLGGMHEEGRRAGAGERGRDLVPHVPGLAHAHDHDVALAVGAALLVAQVAAGAHELLVQGVGELRQRRGLDLEHAPAELLVGLAALPAPEQGEFLPHLAGFGLVVAARRH